MLSPGSDSLPPDAFRKWPSWPLRLCREVVESTNKIQYTQNSRLGGIIHRNCRRCNSQAFFHSTYTVYIQVLNASGVRQPPTNYTTALTISEIRTSSLDKQQSYWDELGLFDQDAIGISLWILVLTCRRWEWIPHWAHDQVREPNRPDSSRQARGGLAPFGTRKEFPWGWYHSPLLKKFRESSHNHHLFFSQREVISIYTGPSQCLVLKVRHGVQSTAKRADDHRIYHSTFGMAIFNCHWAHSVTNSALKALIEPQQKQKHISSEYVKNIEHSCTNEYY